METVTLGLSSIKHNVPTQGGFYKTLTNITDSNEITVGNTYFVPSSFGGLYRVQCVSNTDTKIHLKGLHGDNKHLTYEVDCQLPEMFEDEFNALIAALGTAPHELTREQRSLINKGNVYGFANTMSYTQYGISTAGVEKGRALGLFPEVRH